MEMTEFKNLLLKGEEGVIKLSLDQIHEMVSLDHEYPGLVLKSGGSDRGTMEPDVEDVEILHVTYKGHSGLFWERGGEVYFNPISFTFPKKTVNQLMRWLGR